MAVGCRARFGAGIVLTSPHPPVAGGRAEDRRRAGQIDRLLEDVRRVGKAAEEAAAAAIAEKRDPWLKLADEGRPRGS